jgi:hypothetical protein
VLAAAAGTVLDGRLGHLWLGRLRPARLHPARLQRRRPQVHQLCTPTSTGVSVSKGQKDRQGPGSRHPRPVLQPGPELRQLRHPHLHFALHRDSGFGGSGSGGSYGGRAVLPEPIDGYSGLLKGQDLISKNGDEEPPPPPKICDPDPARRDHPRRRRPLPHPRRQAREWSHSDGLSAATPPTPPKTSPPPTTPKPAYGSLSFEQAGNYDLWVYSPAAPPKPHRRRHLQEQLRRRPSRQGPRRSGRQRRHMGASRDMAFRPGSGSLDSASATTTSPGHQDKNVVVDDLRIAPAAPCLCDQPARPRANPAATAASSSAPATAASGPTGPLARSAPPAATAPPIPPPPVPPPPARPPPAAAAPATLAAAPATPPPPAPPRAPPQATRTPAPAAASAPPPAPPPAPALASLSPT